jgi:hypothetical protein
MKELNKEKEFERLLKRKAEGFDLKPSDRVWSEVASSLQKRRRRGIIGWMMAALLIVAVGTATYFMMQNEKVTNPFSVTNEQKPESSALNKSTVDDRNAGQQVHAPSSNDNVSANKGLTEQMKNAPVQRQIDYAEAKSENALLSESMQQEAMEPLSCRPSALMATEGNREQVTIEKKFTHSSALVSLEEMMTPHFTVEWEGMPLATYSWNSQPLNLSPTNTQSKPSRNSYWLWQGFSTGGNFLFHLSKNWFAGAGLHYTSTHTRIGLPEQAVVWYDTSYTTINSTSYMTIDTSYFVYEPQENFSQGWFDISFITGTDLFPDAKNHLRIAGGVAYSRLLHVKSEMESPAESLNQDASVISGSFGGLSTGSIPQVVFRKNQLQLFSEIAYVRELGPHFGFSAGGQLHYYPSNLFEGNELFHHMLWLGLKAGVQYSF